MYFWQARQDLNLQPPVLETGALAVRATDLRFFILFLDGQYVYDNEDNTF